MSFRGSGFGKQIRSAARGSRVGGDPLRTGRLAQAEFSPHGANDSEDPQEGHDLIVMELARVKEIGGLDESMIRERTDATPVPLPAAAAVLSHADSAARRIGFLVTASLPVPGRRGFAGGRGAGSA